MHLEVSWRPYRSLIVLFSRCNKGSGCSKVNSSRATSGGWPSHLVCVWKWTPIFTLGVWFIHYAWYMVDMWLIYGLYMVNIWLNKHWLMLWNMTLIFPYIGNVIIPIDFHIFRMGLKPPASYTWRNGAGGCARRSCTSLLSWSFCHFFCALSSCFPQVLTNYVHLFYCLRVVTGCELATATNQKLKPLIRNRNMSA